jgi:hypothetical protein
MPWITRRARPAPAAPQAAAAALPRQGPGESPPGPPGAAAHAERSLCGWFDSSHDLRTGLLVQEHGLDRVAAAALAQEDGWQWRLAAQCPGSRELPR